MYFSGVGHCHPNFAGKRHGRYEEVAVTTNGTAKDDRAEEDKVKNRAADKLLKVNECGWDMLGTKNLQ